MNEQEKIQLQKNRKVILGIFGVPAVVILLSTILYFLVNSKTIDLGTVNNGELITPPLQFAELSLNTVSGSAFDYSAPEPKWAFTVLGDQHCINACERMLYVARQSIVALGKKMGRVRLIYVTTDGVISSSLQQRFDEEYKGLDVLSVELATLEQLFAQSGLQPLAAQRFYVIDPRGWLMMHYQVEDTQQDTLNTLGKAVVRDMKRLIK